MGNYAYLCRSDLRRTNPSFANQRYAPARNTIACLRGGIPLLWLGLFHPTDLRTDRFVDDGEPVLSRAPVVATRTALASEAQKVAWAAQSARLSRSLDTLYARFREALRQ